MMRHHKILAIIICALIGGWFAADKSDAGIGDNQRSLICLANGYAYLSKERIDNTLEKNAVEAAVSLMEEKAGDYLKNRLSQGTMYEFIKRENSALQLLRIAKVDATQVNENLLGMRVIARIDYLLKGEVGDKLLTMNVDTDKNVYHEGETLTFLLRTNTEANMCLIEQSPDQTIIQIFPNGFNTQERLTIGQHFFPNNENGDNYKFIVGAPYGKTMIYMFGSNKPIGGIANPNEITGNFIQSTEDISKIREKLINKVADSLEDIDSETTFSCAQFVEVQRSLTLEPVQTSK
jgi:hypothetical protein